VDFEAQFNKFWLAATPKIFEWIGWIAALGAIGFVHAKTKSTAALILLLVGYASFFFYS